MTRRITTAIAIAGLLQLGFGTPALAQKTKPCGAKNPCAAKAKDAQAEAATVKVERSRALQGGSTPMWPDVSTAPESRPPGAPPLNSAQSP